MGCVGKDNDIMYVQSCINQLYLSENSYKLNTHKKVQKMKGVYTPIPICLVASEHIRNFYMSMYTFYNDRPVVGREFCSGSVII